MTQNVIAEIENTRGCPVPANWEQASAWLLPVLALDPVELAMMERDVFARAWAAIAWIHPGLHPDEANDHGDDIAMDEVAATGSPTLEAALGCQYYTKSGWPITLAELAAEACRRYEADALADWEFYPADASMARLRSLD